MSLPKTSRALKITMEPHRRHDAATDSCCCSGIHAGRRRRASSGANFAQFGTSPARTRYAISIAFEMCAAHLQRAAHDLSQSSAGWTVEPRSVPNRASGKNRDIFPDLDNLRLDLVFNKVNVQASQCNSIKGASRRHGSPRTDMRPVNSLLFAY